VIAGVIPAAGEVAPHIGAVLHSRVAAPVDASGRGQVARALRFVEDMRLLQRRSIVERLRDELRREECRKQRQTSRDDAGKSLLMIHVSPWLTR
jgi:hypothetical protein